MSDEHLDLYELMPSESELLELVFAHADESMIREIAEADYGMDAKEHMESLLKIKNGSIPAPLAPQEVLELTCWLEPDALSSCNPGEAGTRGHWMRLLASAVLLRAVVEPETYGHFIAEDRMVIRLVESAMRLGGETSLAALRFLSWCLFSNTVDESLRALIAVAVLLLAVALDRCNPRIGQYLISAGFDVYRHDLYNQCPDKKKWKEVTRHVLLAATQMDWQLRRFGQALVGREDLI